MTSLTADRVRELAADYQQAEPFAGVETQALETYPEAARIGDLRWRDAEWLVRWYYRRHLSSRYNRWRRQVEDAFRTNDWPDVSDAIETALDLDEPAERIERLCPLAGVDTGVASAVLHFVDPRAETVLAEPEWGALAPQTPLSGAYPTDPTPADYVTFRGHFTDLRRTLDVDGVALRRALWRLATA